MKSEIHRKLSFSIRSFRQRGIVPGNLQKALRLKRASNEALKQRLNGERKSFREIRRQAKRTIKHIGEGADELTDLKSQVINLADQCISGVNYFKQKALDQAQKRFAIPDESHDASDSSCNE